MSKVKTVFIQGNLVPLGIVGVDSGQVMICDPCYIESQWQDKNFEDVRPYMNVKTKEVLSYPKDFSTFGEIIPKYNKDMNTLIQEGVFIKKEKDEDEIDNSFSYNGCCKQTLENESGGGQLVYKMGHDGAGVASRTRHGDGSYEVYAVQDEDGNTKQLIVDFGYEEDKDFIDKQLDNNSPMQELKETLHKVIKHLEKDKSEKSMKLKEEILQQMMEIM